MKLLGSENIEVDGVKKENEIDLKIGITTEEFEAAVNKSYLKNRNRIGVPGFRKGKAPRKIIEKMYGVAIFLNDALDILLPDVLTFAIEDTEFDIVGYPKVVDIDLLDNDTRADITLRCGLRPSVKLGKYKGLSAPKVDVKVTDEEIMREVKSIQERNARIEPVTREAKLGDISIINFEGFLDGVPFEGGKGDNYELELGSGRFIPGFEDKIVGMNVSDERDIDLVFPDDYKADLAGKAVVFKVKLVELKEKQLPELDDEFAKDVSEFDTLDEYKADIRARIEKSRQAEADETFESLLMQQITDSMEVEIPEPMVEEHLDKSMRNFTQQINSLGMQPEQYMKMMGVDAATFRENMREKTIEQIKTSLALEEIAKIEKVEISDEEIEEEYKIVAQEYKMDIDKCKEAVKQKAVEENLKLRAAAKIVTSNAKAEKPKKEEKSNKEDKVKETKK